MDSWPSRPRARILRYPTCESCGAAAGLRCSNCKSSYYCSKSCQEKGWKSHKEVCSALARVEMAVERAMAKQPKVQAPKDAFCYICLEGEGESPSSKLMRGCACRGDSAGFVHIKCLTELARSKEGTSGDPQTVFTAWNQCGNCKQGFQGALEVEMRRRCCRYYRLRPHQEELRYASTRSLAICLGDDGEVDAANQLLDEASTFVGNYKDTLLDLKLSRANMLHRNGQTLEALGLLQAVLPEAKECTANPALYSCTMHRIAEFLLNLHRYQEAHEAAAEVAAYYKARFGSEDPGFLRARIICAIAFAKLGRLEEAKANFEDILSIQVRVLGRDHPDTQRTRRYMYMYSFGFAVPSAG